MDITETKEIPEHLIDIEALFAAKNPRLLRLIPRFVLSWLKRIVHQEEVNGYIYRNRDKTGLPFVEAILKEFGVKVEIKDGRKEKNIHPPLSAHEVSVSASPSGKALSARAASPSAHEVSPSVAQPPLVPSSGRFIIAANHPLGGLDGMALMHALGKFRQDLVFPVNDLLMNVPGLRPLFIPINKHGRNTENAQLIEEAFASDKTILYFPAGLCSRKTNRPLPEIGPHPSSEPRREKCTIQDLEWKTTFIKKAKKYQRDIIPVYIEGRNSDWFYNLSNWRKRVGIKANIEMLYLVDEMAKQLGKTITLMIGDPIPCTTFDKSKTDAEWAEWVRARVYGLRKTW